MTNQPKILLEWEGDIDGVKCPECKDYDDGGCIVVVVRRGNPHPLCQEGCEDSVHRGAYSNQMGLCPSCHGTGLITQRVKVKVEIHVLFGIDNSNREAIRYTAENAVKDIDGYDIFSLDKLLEKLLSRHKAGEKVEGVTVI